MLSKAALEIMEESRQEGRAEGERAQLIRQLERRFGALSQDLRLRIEGADRAQLDLWSDRMFGARSIEEIFGSTRS